MRTLLVSLSFAILSLFACASCKKSGDLNPDFLTGTYDIKATLSYGSSGAITTERPQPGTLTISRLTSTSNSLLFVEQFPGYSRTYSGYVDGLQFTVDKKQESITVDGKPYLGVMNGSGQFSIDRKTLKIDTSTDAVVNGPYNRSVKIEGTRQ